MLFVSFFRQWQLVPGVFALPHGASNRGGSGSPSDGYLTTAARLLAIGVKDTPMFGKPLLPPNGGPVAPDPPVGLSGVPWRSRKFGAPAVSK